MKLETLKNKRISGKKIFTDMDMIFNQKTIFLKLEDVKSAVEGLKQDLKKHMISSRDIDGNYSKAYSVAMEQAIKLVDEWFEDVIE